MAAMTSKFYFGCVIQYYSDQWTHPCSREHKMANEKFSIDKSQVISFSLFCQGEKTELKRGIYRIISRFGDILTSQ